MNQRNIVIDLKAQVTGYEESLKKLQNAITKVDPGSVIGKQLARAIEQAEVQLKDLGKNLMPRASNDTQIDSIIEKANRAGEAVQQVASLMQHVEVKDLDISALGNSIDGLNYRILGLKTELETALTSGLHTFINDSEALNDVFKNLLHIDNVSEMEPQKIFDVLSTAAQQAATDVEAANKALEKAQRDLAQKYKDIQNLEQSPLANENQAKQDLHGIIEKYTNTFNVIKERIRNGLNEIYNNNENEVNPIMEAFTKNLNIGTLKARLKEVQDKLQATVLKDFNVHDIFSKLAGSENIPSSKANSSNIASLWMADLNKAMPEIYQRLEQYIANMSSSLTTNEAGLLKKALNEKDIDAFMKIAEKAIERGNTRIVGLIAQTKGKVENNLKEIDEKNQAVALANDNKIKIDTANTNIQTQYNQLREENNQLKNHIAALEQEVAGIKSQAASSIRTEGAQQNLNVEQFKLGIDAAYKYKSALEQVHEREQLIGRIQGVVQRWFSIYAAVRMVGNAIRSVISTIKELDKTITEIAIVTDMTQQDLWGQMNSYTEMAREYASSISGVYKVSQLYYQQGKFMV